MVKLMAFLKKTCYYLSYVSIRNLFKESFLKDMLSDEIRYQILLALCKAFI